MHVQTLPILVPWPSIEQTLDYAGRMMNSLFNGAAYERSSILPKLLAAPEFWLIAGHGPHDPDITEQIIADLEGLMAAQTQHLQRGRVNLFDPCRFWALVQAIRGEQRILEEQMRRRARRHAAAQQDIEEALRPANSNQACGCTEADAGPDGLCPHGN